VNLNEAQQQADEFDAPVYRRLNEALAPANESHAKSWPETQWAYSMPKPHPNSGFSKFESHVESMLEQLFAGFRHHKTQQRFTSVNKRPDFTLMSQEDHRDRLIVDAKFCQSIGVREVKQVQGYKGHPFMAGKAAIVVPKNCEVEQAAIELAQKKKVMIVRVDASKKQSYGIGRVLSLIPWLEHRG